jgi:hypothetical protein
MRSGRPPSNSVRGVTVAVVSDIRANQPEFDFQPKFLCERPTRLRFPTPNHPKGWAAIVAGTELRPAPARRNGFDLANAATAGMPLRTDRRSAVLQAKMAGLPFHARKRLNHRGQKVRRRQIFESSSDAASVSDAKPYPGGRPVIEPAPSRAPCPPARPARRVPCGADASAKRSARRAFKHGLDRRGRERAACAVDISKARKLRCDFS